MQPLKIQKKQTLIKYKCLLDLLSCECEGEEYEQPSTAVLRYKEDYKCKYPTNAKLPIDIATKEYAKYVDWKGW